MKIVVIDEGYPSEHNTVGDMFAHVRIKAYKKVFDDIIVFADFGRIGEYCYEGVNVICPGSLENMYQKIKLMDPDIILVHFATYPVITHIIEKIDKPYIVWVHGYEALGWYRRLFNYKKFRDFLYYVRTNTKQLYQFRRLIKRSNKQKRIHFVFVSEWMKKITSLDCLVRVKNYHIIPNPIDNKLFFPVEKATDLRKRILLIRPFNSKKYATDIATEMMIQLQKESFFKELNFTIYGGGSTSSQMYQIFKDCDNVKINEGYLNQEEIKALHDDNGIFIALTRQDAQGVSMCEAMSSGLVVISSNNTAIPEFVTDRYSGFLTNNKPKEAAAVIKELYENPELFRSISGQGAISIRKKSGIAKVIEREIEIIQNVAGNQEKSSLEKTIAFNG